jgi:hypothetical protein
MHDDGVIVMIHKFVRDLYALKYAGTSCSMPIVPFVFLWWPHFAYPSIIHRTGTVGTQSIGLCKSCQSYWQRNCNDLFALILSSPLHHDVMLLPCHVDVHRIYH